MKPIDSSEAEFECDSVVKGETVEDVMKNWVQYT